MKKLLLLFFTGLALISTAQSGYNKKEFRQKFIQGNLLILEQFYDTALTTFLELRKMDSTNANVNYKIGYCYLMSGSRKKMALPYFEKAAEKVTRKYIDDEPNERSAPEVVYFYLAQSYHLNGKFDRAVDYFNKFKEIIGSKDKKLLDDVNHRIEWAFNAIEMKKNPVGCTIVYSAVITADESYLYFTSRRPGMGGFNNRSLDGGFYEDIWYCEKKPDGTWSTAKPVGAPVNTLDNDATISITPDGYTMLIYKDEKGDGNIFVSEFNGNSWSQPENIESTNTIPTDINSKAWEPSACLNADGTILYFVSDRKGGYGGRDIYRVKRLPNGNWSLAQNLGPTINTPYDEDAPFIHPDGTTFFFSSSGHKSMGGFDIFYTSLIDTSWLPPKNLGYPVNTEGDDIFYYTSADGKRGYYATSAEGSGDNDIYMITFDISVVEPIVLLKGIITLDGKLDSVPPSVTITARNMETGEELPMVKPHPVTGKYILILKPGDKAVTYSISYEADSLQPIVETITVDPKDSYTEIDRGVDLRTINFEKKTLGTISVTGTIKDEKGKPVEVTNIIVKDNVTGKLMETYHSNSLSGAYYFVLERGKNYNISYEAENYLFQSVNVNVPKKPEYSELVKDIVLEKVKVGSKIVLNNIFFDSGKSSLRKESNIELDKLIKLLKEYESIKIEISGHTDSKGDAKVNLALSQKRAQAVVDYLVKKGISKTRLIAKGYGKQQPVAPEKLPNGKPDLAGMQKNRRVELKIVE
jgi:outer membrane protein OmpA-like peptidoglycan-associated protein